MKSDNSNKFKLGKRFYFTLLIGAAALILLYFFIQREYFSKMLSVLQPIIIGIIIAYLLNPLVKALEKLFGKLFKKRFKKERTRKNFVRGFSITVSVIALLAVMTAVISLIVPQMLKSINDLINDLPNMINHATEFYNSFIAKYDLPNRFSEFTAWYTETFGGSAASFDLNSVLTGLFSGMQNGIISSIGTVGNGLVSVFSTIFNFVIGLVVTVYVLACKESMFAQFKKVMYAFLSRRRVDTLIETSRECNNIVTNFIISKLIASIIVGILCFILMMIFRIPYALLISVIIAITDIIPFFGPYIGTIPSALLILLSDPIKALYFVIMIVVIQQIEGNIISPKLIGDSIGVSPFWVMFAMIFGGGMFGLSGMLLGVPVFAIIFFIIRQVAGKRLRDKDLPTKTDEYVAEGIYKATAGETSDNSDNTEESD